MLRDGVHYVYGVLSIKVHIPFMTSHHHETAAMRLFTNVLDAHHLSWLQQNWQLLSKLILKDPIPF